MGLVSSIDDGKINHYPSRTSWQDGYIDCVRSIRQLWGLKPLAIPAGPVAVVYTEDRSIINLHSWPGPLRLRYRIIIGAATDERN